MEPALLSEVTYLKSHTASKSQGLISQMGDVRIFAAACVMAVLTSGGVFYAPQAFAAGAPDAESSEFGVGDVLPAEEVHIISQPGLYGLGPEPADSKYAIAHGMLIRIDPKTGKVLSILRSQSTVLD